MSTRALRKVRKLRAEDDDNIDDDSNASPSEDNGEIVSNVTAINPFNLLGSEEAHVDGDSAEDQVLTEHSHCKKKTKQKKKGKTKVQNKADAEVDDIETVIREVNGMASNRHGASQQSWTNDGRINAKTLLTVEHKHLNADNEMRRIFGARVVKSATRGRNTQRHEMHKSTWLAKRKDTWPSLSKSGLSMRSVETKQGMHYFTFEHNKSYQEVQFLFLDAVESSDPQNIMNILKVHPYHIDSLLQLSEICKVNEDVQTASDLIERALYVFETNFHSLFNLTQGNCRLDYRKPENRAFFLALFRQVMFVGQRGCYRTALELCKLLLSLDPDGDPMCVLLMIDFYAIQAEDYTFLINLQRELQSDKNLNQLPNFAFSIALASFLGAERQGSSNDEASMLLQTALLMFPGVLMCLLEKCSIQPDDEVSKCSFFVDRNYKEEQKAVQQLQMLFIGRCSSRWKLPAVVEWLESNVKEVMARVRQNDPCITEYREITRRYRGTPRNIYRHILISDIKEATVSLPLEMAHTPILSYDPLPPADSIQSYPRPERLRRTQHEANPLSLFFRSMLPNFNPQEVVEEAAGAAGGDRVRQGWDTLMNALRDMVNNVNFVPPPVENHHEEEENHEDFD